MTLTQIDQVSQDTDKKFDGGRITATEKLTLTSFSCYENTLISAPVIRAATNALTLMGETQFKDVERLELGSTMSVYRDDWCKRSSHSADAGFDNSHRHADGQQVGDDGWNADDLEPR